MHKCMRIFTNFRILVAEKLEEKQVVPKFVVTLWFIELDLFKLIESVEKNK